MKFEKRKAPGIFFSVTPWVYLLLEAAFFCFPKNTSSVVLPPANDSCEDAIAIQIGFGTGVFTTSPVDMTDATRETFEYFDGPMLTAGLDKKSIWYKFTLPTAREVKLEWNTSSQLAADQVGFTVFRATDCNGLNGSTAGALPAATQLGESKDDCLMSGTYYIQVCGRDDANGLVFLHLTIEPPYTSDPPGTARYDLPEAAFNFGQLGNSPHTVEYEVGCQSIDASWEYENLPVAVAADFNKSTWHVFTTGAFFDLLSIIAEPENGGAAIPDELGFRLYQGDVLQNEPTSLPVVEDIRLLHVMGTKQVREYICDSLLLPNTTYSFQLIFHKDYYNNNLQVRLCQFGDQPTGAPVPDTDLANPSNILGILPSGTNGVTTSLNDHLACDASLFLSQNQCGSVNAAGGVAFNNQTYDLVTWASFSLAEDATVQFTYDEPAGNSSFRYARIFRGELPDDCEAIDVAADFFADFVTDLEYSCMPAGHYSIQLLAQSQHPTQPATTPRCDGGVLGRPVRLRIEVTSIKNISNFGLWAPGAVDEINGLLPLEEGTSYQATADTIGCRNTVLPEGGTCPDQSKAIYRTFNIGEPGMLRLFNLRTYDFRYKLYYGNLADSALAQNAFLATDTIFGAVGVSGSDCIYQNNYIYGYYCVEPGDYTLVTFANGTKTGRVDQPWFRFQSLKTHHPTRELAENLGNIVPQPDTMIVFNCSNLPIDTLLLAMDTVVTSSRDTFSCLSNPDTIGGIAPCNSRGKLIYREFFLSEPRILSIRRVGVGYVSLFVGRASDPAVQLQAFTGKNDSGVDWVNCFSNQQRTDPCEPVPAGWYTVVAYGGGATYQNPDNGHPNAEQFDLGKYNAITITSEPAPEELYDTPAEALQINNCMPTDWDFAALSNNYPYTVENYQLDLMDFGCTEDLPWANHPVVPCQPDESYSLYMVFSITAPSFVRITGIDNMLSTALFPFDAINDPDSLLTVPTVYPCSDPQYSELQICNLQPGSYTLVVFRGANDPASIEPRLIVERSGVSRFDHAVQAYDFGIIEGTDSLYRGKPGDVHPVNPNLPPSNDFFYCSTGAWPTDPQMDICSNILAYNPLIYAGGVINPPNNPQYLDELPEPANNQLPSLRNLWYTFVLTGSGTAEVSLRYFPSNYNTGPRFAIYKSEKNGAIPFSELVTNGMVDSVFADSLLVISNKTNSSCFSRAASVTFPKDICLADTVRYYLIVTMWNNVQPNQQIDVSIKYDGEASLPVKYDLFSHANRINGLNETSPPYTPAILGEGMYFGAPASLECATRSVADPLTSSCYNRSVWYRIDVQGTGTFRLAHEQAGVPNTQAASPQMRLFRETIPGDSTSLEEITLADFYENNPNNPTGHDWREGCYETGTYYIFWEDCSDDFNIFLPYRPIVWLLESPGDFCGNAITTLVDSPGVTTAQARVDCHTIGESYGEDGSNMGCLQGPAGLKSTWFKFVLATAEKQDVNFSFNISDLKTSSGTALQAGQARARILYGSCAAMTPGSCLSSGTAAITLNCLDVGDYYVQVVTPAGTTGEVLVNFSAIPSTDQACFPICEDCPVANFTAVPDCHSDMVTLNNYSTAGDSVFYEWTFPNQPVSNAFLPAWNMPKTDQIQVVEVTLLVRNMENGKVDVLTKEVAIPPRFTAFPADSLTLCNCGDTILTVPYTNIQVSWQDGSTDTSLPVSSPGLYWVTLEGYGCSGADSVVVSMESCTFYDTIPATVCRGDFFNGELFTQDTLLTRSYFDNCDNNMVETTALHLLDTFFIIVDTVSVCEGDTIVFEGRQIWEAGLHPVSLVSSEGCDSTRALFVQIEVLQTVNDTTWLCQGDDFNGLGIFSDTILCSVDTDVNGCDSTHCQFVFFRDTFSVVEEVFICEMESFDFDGTALNATGIYCKTFTSQQTGCDSVHCIDLTVRDTVLTLLFPEICEGESFTVGDSVYVSAGQYTNFLVAVNGCDSTVLTQLVVHSLPVPSINGGEAPFCNGDSILLDAGPGFVHYEWSNGDTIQTTWSWQSESLTVLVENEYGCLASDTVVTESVALDILVSVVSDFNGNAVSCYGAADGEILAEALGAYPPFQFVWSDGSMTPGLDNLRAGSYFVTVSNDINCTITDSILLSEPLPLGADLETNLPVCFGEANGTLLISGTGGTTPYQFALNSLDFQTEPVFSRLPSGNYELLLIDENGCLWDSSFFLSQPPNWYLNLVPDSAVIILGESAVFTRQTNLDNPAVEIWTPMEDIECDMGCEHPVLSPQSTTQYVLQLEDSLGCRVQDTIFVMVKEEGILFVPNAFSPNGDGINDKFTLFAGPSVARINTLRVFDRWGGLVFETFRIPPNNVSLGWDGQQKGQPAAIGVYAFVATIEFVDGVVEVVKGEVGLIR